MGAGSARAAEKAIERDTWGAGKMGAVKTGCPGGCKKMYRIHPSVGIARVGNAGLHGTPNEYFIGAETESFKAPDRYYTLLADVTKHPVETLIAKSAEKTIYKHSRGDPAAPPERQGHIRRQAARFRIYEYRELKSGQWAWVREITSDDASIEWTVKVANTKAAFFDFSGPESASKRSGPTIEPAEQTVKIKHGFNRKKHPLERKELKDAGKLIEHLGEVFHDEKGRLLFLGGHGEAKGPVGSQVGNYANNAGWVDDVSDGYIKAKITFPRASKKKPEEVYEIKEDSGAAWVMVGPPDFGPELTSITSLYDLMLDIAAQTKTPASEEDRVVFRMHGVEDRAKADFEPHFDYDLLRLFEATYQTATVFKPANPAMKHPAVYKLAKNTKLDDKADPAAAFLRYKIFNTLRPPGEQRRRDPYEVVFKPLGGGAPPPLRPTERYDDDGVDGDVSTDANYVAPPAGYTELPRAIQYRWTMPMLWGDSITNYTDTRYAVTPLQYKAVKQWNDGKFTDTKAAHLSFDKIPRSSAVTPGGLDRAALERTIGGPFFPGIEASWLTRSDEVYGEPFRVKIGASITKEIVYGPFTSDAIAGKAGTVGPGFFSRQMAQPWQADFLACARTQGSIALIKNRIGWWPSQRPDDVVRGDPFVPDPEALEAPTAVVRAGRTVGKAKLKKSGLDLMAKHPRNVSIMTAGADAAMAPKFAIIKGKGESGESLSESILLAGVVGTDEGRLLFKSVTEVKYGPWSPPAPPLPATIDVTLAIGFGSLRGRPNSASPSALEDAREVESIERKVTTFKSEGTIELSGYARNITLTSSGPSPEQAPKTAELKGTDEDGRPLTETIQIDRKAGTYPGKALFKTLTEVKYAPGELPRQLKATTAIGFAAGAGFGAERGALEGATKVDSTARTVTTFKPKGIAALAKNARKIMITTGGSKPDQAPLMASVTGTAKDGSALSEVLVPRNVAGSVQTTAEFATVTEVKLMSGTAPARLDAKVSIGIGEFLGDMEPWDKGIAEIDLTADAMHNNATHWYRLGFVMNGREVERDSTL